MQKAYIVTSGILIIVPALLALSFANGYYLFTRGYQLKKAVYEKCTDSNSRPELYFANFVVGVVFLVTWSPWCFLQLYEAMPLTPNATAAATVGPDEDHALTAPTFLHFSFMWIAIANSLWKFVVYVFLSHDFRVGLKVLYSTLPCTSMEAIEPGFV